MRVAVVCIVMALTFMLGCQPQENSEVILNDSSSTADSIVSVAPEETEELAVDDVSKFVEEPAADEVKVVYKTTDRFLTKEGWIKATYINDELKHLCAFFLGETHQATVDYFFSDNCIIGFATSLPYDEPLNQNMMTVRNIIMNDTLYQYADNDSPLIELSADEKLRMQVAIARLLMEFEIPER